MSRDYTEITDEQLRAINKRAIEQPSYEQLREQNRVLAEALQTAKYELAALFPIPSAPTVHAALKVCGNNNEADARCIYLAYEAICAALTDTRRAALLEAAQVAITYGGRARDEDLSGSYTSELIVQALDRLAQEGASSIDLSPTIKDDGGYGEHF